MPRTGNPQRPRTHVRGLFSRRRFVVAAPALLSLSLNVIVALLTGIPRPTYHDEFSYLLASDTLAHLRATNPPHQFWQHFETIHVIQQPTYASKYPPAQGLFMAAGQLALALPIVGIWIASALACAAVTWALMSYFPRRWALIGGIIAAIHPLTLLWSQEYWGGAVPMLGGALLLGGAVRVLRWPRAFDALLFATGVAILANSRPYEGLVFTLVVTMVLGINSIRSRRVRWGGLLQRAVVPAAALVALIGCAMAYYNNRVTGSALRLPYMVHEEQYGLTPLFLFQKPRPIPDYRHDAIEQYHARWAMPWHTSQQSLDGFLSVLFRIKLKELATDFTATGVLVLPLIVGLISLRRNRRLRPIALMLLLFLLALLPATWVQTHYAAPAFVLLLALAVGGLRRISDWLLGRGIVALVLVALLIAFSMQAYGIVMKSIDPHHFANRRHDTIEQLLQTGDRHLVFVRYGPGHDVHEEWVYNAADIDASLIVWARDISPEDNRKLMDHFKDRAVHRLDVAGGQAMLTPVRPPLVR